MDNTTLLIGGIGALASSITALVLYIKSLHKKHEERLTSLYEKNIDMATKFVEAINKEQSSGERLTDALDRNTVTVNDLHKYIMSQK